jgi:hypothetical protein
MRGDWVDLHSSTNPRSSEKGRISDDIDRDRTARGTKHEVKLRLRCSTGTAKPFRRGERRGEKRTYDGYEIDVRGAEDADSKRFEVSIVGFEVGGLLCEDGYADAVGVIPPVVEVEEEL